MSFERQYAEIYDALYSDKDYVAEANYIYRILSQTLSAKSPQILEVGMGTGKHAVILLSLIQDCSIVGLEPSGYMADKALKKGLDVIQADAQSGMSAFNDISLDVVLALFHVVSYITDPKDLADFLDEVFRILKPGGIFFFDVWHKPAVLNLGMTLRVKRARTEDGRQVVRIAYPTIDEANSIGTVRYEIFLEDAVAKGFTRIQEDHSLRFFDHMEIVELAKNAGFEVIQSHEFLTLKEPSSATWGVSYVVSKPKP